MKYITELNGNPKDEEKKQAFFHALVGSGVGFEVLAPIAICLTLGLIFDNVFHVRPVMTVFFLFLGAFGSFFTIYKIIERERNASRKH